MFSSLTATVCLLARKYHDGGRYSSTHSRVISTGTDSFHSHEEQEFVRCDSESGGSITNSSDFREAAISQVSTPTDLKTKKVL